MIYIGIPAHDEAATIGLVLWKIRQVFTELPRDYEMLVVDDGSTDGTADVLAPYARVLPLTILRNEGRRGYAQSLERLVREVVARASHPRRDIMVVIQADFSESPEDIPALVKRMEGGADVVEIAAAELEPGPPRLLRWFRRSLPWMLRATPPPEGIANPLTGFRAYRLSILKKVVGEREDGNLFTRDGLAANLELVFAVAPHVRRAETVESTVLASRKQRASRLRSWSTLTSLWDVVRQARRNPPSLPNADATG